MIDQTTAAAALADARLAAMQFDGALAWLRTRPVLTDPLAAEVWVFDPDLSHIVLVEHRNRGWVPPGGTVEHQETPRNAAARELLEEAGVAANLLPIPAAVAVRAFRADWTPTLSLSYTAIISRDVHLRGEHGQPVKWANLQEAWPSVFAEDRDRIHAYVHLIKTGQVIGQH